MPQKTIWRRIMENKKRDSERDKLLEDILSSVEKGRTSNRAERAAASSANRAASEKRTASSERTTAYQRTSYETASLKSKKTSDTVYSRSGAKKNTYSERTGSVRRTSDVSKTAAVRRSDTSFTQRTGSIRGNTSVAERTGSMKTSNTSYTERVGSDAPEYRSHSTGIINNTGVMTGEMRSSQPEADYERTAPVRKKRRRFSGRLPLVLIVTTIIFTIAISLSLLIISVGRDMLAIGKSDDIKIISIPEGANTDEVAQILYDEGIIKMPKAFVFISKLGGSDTKYIAGDHELSPSNAYETIISELTTDKSLEKETVDVTFVEGCDLISAGKQLEEAGVCDAERFVYYFNAGDYGFEFEKFLPASTASKFNRMEGYLFPDTYTFYVDTDPEVVCQKIYKNFNEKFKPEYYTQMKKMNMTLDEVVTLASIVQAESPDIETMKKVASVFENRLSNPEEYPKLQSDPTTYYVDEVIKPNIEIPSEAIFEAYDTYKCNGLPPGAIGNPGKDAIEAVLYPAKTDYYFFYANIDTGETFFAETDDEHEDNKDMVKEQQSADDESEE